MPLQFLQTGSRDDFDQRELYETEGVFIVRKLFHSLKVEFLLLSRSIFFWTILLLSIPTLFVLFLRGLLPFDLLDPFISIAAFVQAGIFIFMILGYYLIKSESENSSMEVFQSIPNGYLIKAASKLITIFIVSFIFYILSLSILFLAYSSYSVPANIYFASLPYLCLYVAIPFFLSSLIGMITGTFTQSRIAYAVFVVCWFLIGPLNMSIAEPLMAILKQDFSPVLGFLNLGPMEPNIPYDPIYGLSLEIDRWYQRGIFFIILLSLFLLRVMKINELQLSKRGFAIPLLAVAVLIPFVYEYSQPSQVLQVLQGENAQLRYDSNYYKNHKVVAASHSTATIHSYELQLYPSRVLSAQATIVLSPNEQVLAFTLYHRLKVKQVLVNQAEVKFDQQADQVQIRLPESVRSDERISVAMRYEGISSPFFFANEQALMLPNYFAWYPIPGSYPIMSYDNSELFQYPFVLDQSIPFTLKYSGPQKIYTNIPKKGNGEWSGITKDGLTVVSGMVKSKRMDQTDIYYPEPMTTMEKDIPDFLVSLKKTSDIVNQELGSKLNINVSKIFFLTVPDREGFSRASFSFSPDQLIVSTVPGYNSPHAISDAEMLVPSLVYANLLTEGGFYQKSEIKNLFVNSYYYWFNRRFHTISGEAIPLKSDLEGYELTMKNDPTDKRPLQITQTIKHLIQFIDQNEKHPEILCPFFREWLARLNQKDLMTLSEIEQIIQKAGQRR